MGPLSGFKVLEIEGIGPVPMCGMILSDLGAEVLRIDRTTPSGLGLPIPTKYAVTGRGRRSVAVDLKRPEGVEVVLRLVERADALIEGLRPGVTERLGIGPAECSRRNARLVYGRMTGWGQDGPLAQAAGHDTNYIALTGALWSIGRKEAPPVPPLNLIGDFGGGALYLAVGVLAALLEAGKSGRGQVVDAAMTDGSASLMTVFYGMRAAGLWKRERASNVLDSGAPFLEVYETRDGKFVSVAAIERKFYDELLERMGLRRDELPDQYDTSGWPVLKQRFAAAFREKTREEWTRLLEGSDACFAPVLDLDEAPEHPHNRHRRTFVEYGGVVQPAPAPRFDRTPAAIQSPPPERGADTEKALRDWGFTSEEIERLRAAGAVA